MHGKVDEYDVTGMNINRFQRFHSNVQYRANRVVESLGMVYKLHYPNRSMLSARNNKRSPIHERLLHQQHAYFKDVSGWEGADWYGTDVVCGTESARNDGSGNDGNGNGNGNNNNNNTHRTPASQEAIDALQSEDQLSWNREKWFHQWEKEHHACRNNVVLVDMSFMSKFLIQGTEAGAMLNRLSTANVDGKEGEITYTQFLNADGKMEADLTVCKLDSANNTIMGGGNGSAYLVVATDTAHRHVHNWMNRGGNEYRSDNGNKERNWTISDVTGGYAQINIQGNTKNATPSCLLSSCPSCCRLVPLVPLLSCLFFSDLCWRGFLFFQPSKTGPNSRLLMASIVDDCSLENEDFPFRCAKEVGIGYARVLCVRITYLGELGYELYIPSEQALHVYDTIVEAGQKYDLVSIWTVCGAELCCQFGMCLTFLFFFCLLCRNIVG